MFHKTGIPQEVIDVLYQAILHCVEDRTEKDPFVDDAYLRITYRGQHFRVQGLYIEEALKDREAHRHDVAFLDLMIGRNQKGGNEQWEPDFNAIRKLANNYSEIIEIEVCEN